MTSLIVTLGLLLLPQTQAPAPPVTGTGLISGVITSSAGNRPIPNATIRAVHWTGGLGRQIAERADAQGRFTLKDLPAGSYDIQAQTDGHVSLRYGQRALSDAPKRIELADGEQFTTADILLPKFTAIEGQLLDEFGDPMPGVRVMASQVAFVAGKTRLTPAAGTQNVQPTDDRGVFRIYGLAPGEYYLQGVTGPFAGPTDPPGFAVTFYPGTTNPQDAKAVRLETGRDTRGISFAMSPAPMSAISGLVTDADGRPIARGDVSIFGLAGGDIRSFLNGRIATDQNGRFVFRNLAPGSYVIQAYGRPVSGGSLSRAPFGALPVDVNGDRDDLRVVVKGSRMSGRIVFEGTAPQPPSDRVMVNPVPVDFVSAPASGGPPAMTINPDWTFELLNMSGLRIVRTNVGAPGWTLKRVTVGGKEVTDAPIDFRDGDVTDVEVTFTSNAGSIKGAASDDKGPAADVMILAFADEAAKWAFPSRFLGVGRTNSKGEFTIPGLPAGAYLVAPAPAGVVPQTADPAVLGALRKHAVRATVVEGAPATVTVTIN